MQFTAPLAKNRIRIPTKTNLAKNDRLQFKEFLPLKSTNFVMGGYSKPRGETCTKELQALFECLKKWEFDNLPCADFNRIYVDCVDRVHRANLELTEALKKYPQPELGKYPFKAMRRLPSQSYADDIFHRKNKFGKRN
ncbi:unnamed protein product [Gongylonema pulchrum]|uniref:CHCH domain-containing protein n=1 Tax=Gongylonema pulchrum TaxID=637853 RepID=A0A183DVY7_9BILA|nr:unnamed protein product [Gongylonema pulchrum]